MLSEGGPTTVRCFMGHTGSYLPSTRGSHTLPITKGTSTCLCLPCPRYTHIEFKHSPQRDPSPLASLSLNERSRNTSNGRHWSNLWTILMSAEHAGLMISRMAAGEPRALGRRWSADAGGMTVSRAIIICLPFRWTSGLKVVSRWFLVDCLRLLDDLHCFLSWQSFSEDSENGPTLPCVAN